MAGDSVLSLSDEEIRGMSSMPVEPAPVVVDPTEPAAAAVEDEEEAAPAEVIPEVTEPAAAAPEEGGEEGEDVGAAFAEPAAAEATPPAEVVPAAAPAEVVPAAAAPEAVAPAAPVVVDFEQAYKKIMAPFKANGREISLESPEEAVKLMQMGANYTKKMQQLQPSLKILHMLRNNGLLDEGKISFLIDLDKKDPQAIQKLVADSGIQAMDIDADRAKDYVPGDHRVSDAEFGLQTVMDEVTTSPTGMETIRIVTQQWDADSKQALFKEPGLLAVIDTQRGNGIYDKISAEIDKQKMLGNLQGVPFIHAYKQVGDALYAMGLLAPPAPAVVTPPAEVQPAAIPVARKTILPAKPVVNSDKVRALPSTRGNQPPSPEVDPLSMPDAEFLKKMENRL